MDAFTVFQQQEASSSVENIIGWNSLFDFSVVLIGQISNDNLMALVKYGKTIPCNPNNSNTR
jgi:hypothetical protein